MRVALVVTLFFAVCVHAFAQDFYKWKDEKGVTHISDCPPGNIDSGVELDTGKRINRAPMGDYKSNENDSIMTQYNKSDHDEKGMPELYRKRLEDIQYEIDMAKAKCVEMDSEKYSARNLEMISFSEKIEILKRRKEARSRLDRLLSEKQRVYDAYYNTQLSVPDYEAGETEIRNVVRHNIPVEEVPPKVEESSHEIPKSPKFGFNGEYYVPTGNGYINTATGSMYQEAGPNQYVGPGGFLREDGNFLHK